MSLRDLAHAISPSWLQDGEAEKYMYVPALVADMTADRVEEGVKQCMPEKCDPSCLPYIGRDRSTVRGLWETDAGYAGRCKTAIYDWHFAGIATGLIRTILAQLWPAAPMIRVVWSAQGTDHRTQWYWLLDSAPVGATPESFSTLSATPYTAKWIWDGIDNRRRFWVILYPNVWGSEWVMRGTKYGPHTRKYGDGHMYGVQGTTPARTAALHGQIQTILQLLRTWKAAHARCEGVVIAYDPTLFDPFSIATYPANVTLPDGGFENYGKDDGSGNYVRARFVDAGYTEGVG